MRPYLFMQVSLLFSSPPFERLVLKKFMEDCCLWEGPSTEAGVEGEEKGVADKV